MSRIFISHSGANNAAALALASWLEANGWSDYFLDIDDSRGIAPGERWMAALAGAVDRCEAVVFLISPAWRDSKYCFAEFFEAKKLGKRIFGVIVEPTSLSQLPEQMTAEWQVCDLTDARDRLSFTVARLPSVEETVVSFPRAGLEALAHGLHRAGLDASTFVWPPEGDPQRSPYPGLRALEEVDAAVFFGRAASVVRAIDQIRLVRERDVEQLVVILGASGAGKSSFLRAGLLPRLRRDSEHFLVLPPIRPERAALSGSQGLLNSLKGGLAAAAQPMSTARIREDLGSIGLAGILSRIVSAAHHVSRDGLAEPTVIVPVDQAEELFGSDGQDETQQFLTYLDALRRHVAPAESSATGGRRLRVLLVLTMRSDSLPRLQGQAALQAMSPVLFSLPAMPVSEFKAVIEGPAERHSQTVKPLVITPQLTDQLVVDAQGADALPLLALTLEWLYREFTNAQGTRIGHEEYQRLGGVRGVIGMAVERALERPASDPAIPAQRQEQDRLLRQMFPYIATVDPDTGAWKRRVAVRDVLRKKLPQADALVSRLIEQRLLLADSRRLADNAELVEVVEVAHEALLRQWDTLEGWLREFAAALAASESIRRAATDWQRSGRDEALLVHTAHRLQAAEALLSDERLEGRFEPVDGEYLTACRLRDRRELQQREDQLRRIAEQQSARAVLQRRVTWGLSTAALVVVGLLAWIIVQTRAVSVQTSLVLTGAAEVAADQHRYDQSLRLAVLAARASWLRPAHATAAAVLSRAADASALRAVFIGHTGAVVAASFSPNGRRVLTTSLDNTARVWDAETGKPVSQPMTPGEGVSAGFSPDGTRVVTGSRDNTAHVWDVETGKPVGEVMTHRGQINSAGFSSDSRRVVTASQDNTARVWDANTGKPVGPPMTHGNWVLFAGFSPDGKRVITASEDKTARIWDADTGKPVGQPMTHEGRVWSADFSPDGRRVVTTSLDKTIRVWDADTGRPAGDPITFDTAPTAASFSPDGERVVTSSGEEARVWDAATGKPVGEPMTHDGLVASARFSPNGTRVVTASSDSTARVWDAATGEPVDEPLIHDSPLYSASFSPDGLRVVTASIDNIARVWDVDIRRLVGEPMRHASWVASATFNADGQRVVTASQDKTARVWDAATGRSVGEPMTHQELVASAGFSLDGARVVTASWDRTARVWDAATGKPVGEPMRHDGSVGSASFSSSGKRVVTISDHTIARVWDVDTGKPVGEPMKHREELVSASFSPDDARVVTASWDKTARVWDAVTGRPVSEPMLHDGLVVAASFSPDGKHVVTASQDKTARVWDAATGKPVSGPMTHRAPVGSARFSPNGTRVVTASVDRTARVWDAFSGKPVGEPMTAGDQVVSASFSPDGLRVVTASGREARVWDAATGKPVSEPMRPVKGVKAATFSPDGQHVVMVSEYEARVWDAFWPSVVRPQNLIDEVCQRKLRGTVRTITEADVRAAGILSYDRVGEDVCNGVAPVSAR